MPKWYQLKRPKYRAYRTVYSMRLKLPTNTKLSNFSWYLFLQIIMISESSFSSHRLMIYIQNLQEKKKKKAIHKVLETGSTPAASEMD